MRVTIAGHWAHGNESVITLENDGRVGYDYPSTTNGDVGCRPVIRLPETAKTGSSSAPWGLTS